MRRHGWAYRLLQNLETDHEAQIRFHKRAIVFWVCNVPVALVLLILWPHLWQALGVFYVLLLSLYANADTDYDAMSAAQAALHAQRAERNTSERGSAASGD